MSRHDPTVALLHMLDHAREALVLVTNRTSKEFKEDRVLNLALVRLIEIVGEAAGRVPDEVRIRHTDIPWRQIVGMRNCLTHGYDAVDLDILWEVITKDLPPLVEQLEATLAHRR